MSERATCDTSVLVPALAAWHGDHGTARRALLRVAALPAHVLIEAYSVFTRLPAPHRVDAADAASAIGALDLELLQLPGGEHRTLVRRLAEAGVSGGAVYDGLVAAAAAHHGLLLLTRDRRARATYDVVGARYALV